MAPLNISTSPFIKCVNMTERIKFSGSLLDAQASDVTMRIFPVQLFLVSFLQATVQFLLRPLGTVPAVAHILSGILIGPTGFLRFEYFQKAMFFDIYGNMDDLSLPGTLGLFGMMMYIFLVGVKSDFSILVRSSSRERAIGILTFLVPVFLTQPLSFILVKNGPEILSDMNLPMVAALASTSSFHTIVCFLADLKILNTELGRLATSASSISGLFSMILVLLTHSVKQLTTASAKIWLLYLLTTLAQLLFITLVLRKVVILMVKLTPRGESMKERYLLVIFFMIFGTAFMGEWFGIHCLWGPMVLGLVIPDGPPLGTTLVQVLDPFVSGLLMPLFFSNIGVAINFGQVEAQHWFGVTLFTVLSFIGKLTGTIIPCLYYQMPLRDSFTLGLILSTLGTFDILSQSSAMKFVGPHVFSVMVIYILLLATITSPLVRFLYYPSRRYIVYKNHNIQNVKDNSELRILVCIYNEDSVPTIVNILEASNPTRENPFCVYLLHLIELQGRSTPLLISHKYHEKLFHEPTQSEHIINGFKIFEKQNQGFVYVHPFTSFTPFFSAHDDICTIAIDKRSFIMIIPFHKKWNIDGTTQNCKWSNANKKVLKHAPCSVGILIDRGVLNGARSVLSSCSNYRVGVIFLGDADDREALCFAMRMARNPNVSVIVHRLILADMERSSVAENVLDGDVVNEYILDNRNSERNLYKEVVVKDGVDIINVIQSMENCYDLILVGRSHHSSATIFSGLSEWSEYPELGFFGDLFASSDFKGNASVLVLQQHSCVQRNVISNENQSPDIVVIHNEI